MDTTEMGLLFSSIGFIALLAIIYAVLPEYKALTLQNKINQLESNNIIRILTRNNAKELLKDPKISQRKMNILYHMFPNLKKNKK
jgi:hypothetical protein